MTNSSGASDERPTLDDLRRARGEGWEWPRAATDACPQCGQHAGALPPDSLGPLAVELAGEWREFLLDTDDASLRTIPAPGIFSPLQYGAHVRDILRVYGDRILLALEEENPTVATHNPPEEIWEGYNRLDPGELADDIEAQAQRLAGILADLEPADWSRTVVRDALVHGVDGVYSFTVAGIASYAVHEAYHHLLDANGTLVPDISPT